jgi:hypothetical protein
MNYSQACSILGISTDIILTEDVLKKKYRTLALKYHPDKNTKKNTTELFQEIQEAYCYLENMDFKEGELDPIYTRREKQTTYFHMLFLLLEKMKQVEHPLKDLVLHILSSGWKKVCKQLYESREEEKAREALFLLYSRWKHVLWLDDAFLQDLYSTYKKRDTMILRPTLDVLLDKQIYLVSKKERDYYIPLWIDEIIFEEEEIDRVFVCEPVLQENMWIDEDNNIHVTMKKDCFDESCIEIYLGKKRFLFKKEERIGDMIVLEGQGIPRIHPDDIYDASQTGSIVLHLSKVDV